MRLRKVRNFEQRMQNASGWAVAEPLAMKGRWISELMPGAESLELELGCGKGKFTCDAALASPGKLFIGIEKISGAVLRGMERAAALSLPNARFLTADAKCLTSYFDPGEAGTVYLNFSDPWPHWKQAPLRLTHRSFLEIYAKILSPGGKLVFKTDNVPLFRFSLRELEASGWRLLSQTENLPAGGDNIETDYETNFRSQGINICRVEACRP